MSFDFQHPVRTRLLSFIGLITTSLMVGARNLAVSLYHYCPPSNASVFYIRVHYFPTSDSYHLAAIATLLSRFCRSVNCVLDSRVCLASIFCPKLDAPVGKMSFSDSAPSQPSLECRWHYYLYSCNDGKKS